MEALDMSNKTLGHFQPCQWQQKIFKLKETSGQFAAQKPVFLNETLGHFQGHLSGNKTTERRKTTPQVKAKPLVALNKMSGRFPAMSVCDRTR